MVVLEERSGVTLGTMNIHSKLKVDNELLLRYCSLLWMDKLMDHAIGSASKKKRRKVSVFHGNFLRCTLTHQMSHSTSMIFRTFVVLSRSRKPRDSSSWLVGFLTCGKTEPVVEWPLSFCVWNKAEARGSYIV